MPPSQKAKLLLLMTTAILISSCSSHNRSAGSAISISSLAFIGEQVIPQEQFEGTTVGGLSGIDYQDGTYYLISDDNGSETDDVQGHARAYTAQLGFDEHGFDAIEITGVIPLNTADGQQYKPGTVDPEAIRFDPKTGNLLWVNEGQIKDGIAPEIQEISPGSEVLRSYPLPDMFQIDALGKTGPRHNVVFEGLSMSIEGDDFWISLEGPLIQDGEEAGLEESISPIRISLIERTTGKIQRQFAYELDSVTHREGAEKAFMVNGVVDVLEYAQQQFLVLERSYVSGQADGGNDVKLYKVDASKATDIKDMLALTEVDYLPAEKTLLLDFNSVRNQLTSIDGHHTVDNLEGFTFGPTLPSGKRSLVVVGDNNFSLYAKQLNQFLVFEVNP